jgi:hypothetical protein
MKRIVLLLFTLVMFTACAQTQPTPLPPTQPVTPVPTIMPTTPASAPAETAAVEPVPDTARRTLEQFMQARLEREDETVLGLLSAPLKFELENNTRVIQPPLLQVSNPCWYRYEVLALTATSPSIVAARVRMYEHFWSGDSGGGLPQSWEQPLTLAETGEGWRVSALGNLENQRDEPDEPHGQTLSACIAAQTP